MPVSLEGLQPLTCVQEACTHFSTQIQFKYIKKKHFLCPPEGNQSHNMFREKKLALKLRDVSGS